MANRKKTTTLVLLRVVEEFTDDERPSLSVRTYDTDGSEVTQVTRPIAKCEATDLGRKVGS